MPTEKQIRVGTIACWLFGHKLIGEMHELREDGEMWVKTYPVDFCVRCGARREATDAH